MPERIKSLFFASLRLCVGFFPPYHDEIRDAEAPNLPATDNANKVLDGIDNRITLQITSTF